LQRILIKTEIRKKKKEKNKEKGKGPKGNDSAQPPKQPTVQDLVSLKRYAGRLRSSLTRRAHLAGLSSSSG
jgi:hypothetical protein